MRSCVKQSKFRHDPPVEVEITGVDSSGLAVAYIQGEMPDPLPLQHGDIVIFSSP